MWVLLGSNSFEEDFGGFQLHRDIFLGVFDSYETALEFKTNKVVQANYEKVEIIQVDPNRLVVDTGVDWYK